VRWNPAAPTPLHLLRISSLADGGFEERNETSTHRVARQCCLKVVAPCCSSPPAALLRASIEPQAGSLAKGKTRASVAAAASNGSPHDLVGLPFGAASRTRTSGSVIRPFRPHARATRTGETPASFIVCLLCAEASGGRRTRRKLLILKSIPKGAEFEPQPLYFHRLREISPTGGYLPAGRDRGLTKWRNRSASA
jgi:hypothetical protein